MPKRSDVQKKIDGAFDLKTAIDNLEQAIQKNLGWNGDKSVFQGCLVNVCDVELLLQSHAADIRECAKVAGERDRAENKAMAYFEKMERLEKQLRSAT